MAFDFVLSTKEQEDLVCSIISRQIISDDEFVRPIRGLYPELGDGFEAIIAYQSQKPVGVVTAQRGLAYSNSKDNLFSAIRHDYPSQELWTILDIAVLNQYQGQHVGSGLFRAMENRLFEKGVRFALMEIWVRANGYKPAFNLVHLAPSYRDYGILEDFYSDSPIACDFCKGPCHCKAQVVVLQLDHPGSLGEAVVDSHSIP